MSLNLHPRKKCWKRLALDHWPHSLETGVLNLHSRLSDPSPRTLAFRSFPRVEASGPRTWALASWPMGIGPYDLSPPALAWRVGLHRNQNSRGQSWSQSPCIQILRPWLVDIDSGTLAFGRWPIRLEPSRFWLGALARLHYGLGPVVWDRRLLPPRLRPAGLSQKTLVLDQQSLVPNTSAPILGPLGAGTGPLKICTQQLCL